MIEIKPVAFLINDPQHCTGIHTVQGMIDNGLTHEEMKARWGDAMVPLYTIPEGHSIMPIGKELADGGVAQKAFWHALEFCNDPEERNIRSHWETYKVLLSSRREP